MISAFQPSAFQRTAFQIAASAGAGVGAFQCGAFQRTAFQVPAECHAADAPTSRAKRLPWLRGIVEGYVVPAGVVSFGQVGRVRARGAHRQGVPALALPQGLYSRGFVGALFVSGTNVGGGAKVVPSTPRVVRGHVGVPLARGEARGTCAGVIGKAVLGGVTPHGAACAYPEIRGSKGHVGTPQARGIQNPTNEEILAVLVAARTRRKNRRLTPSLSGRRLPPVSNHLHSLRQ